MTGESHPPSRLSLSLALRCTRPFSVAFVGAGGKTSAVFQVARELAPALVTTSTHLRDWQSAFADRHLVWLPQDPNPLLDENLHSGITLLTSSLDLKSNRHQALNPGQLEELRAISEKYRLPLLIEADGSRQRPLKAPGSHEPAIPEFVDEVVVVAGLIGLNKPLDEAHIHRPEIFAELSGLHLGEIITPAALARVLSSPTGGLKNIPTKALKRLLINQADTIERQAQANELADLLSPIFDSVVISALKPAPGRVISVKENIAGVILAAGGASRYGLPKQLLDFHGKPFVRVIAETALAAGLSPVSLVCGSHVSEVSAAVAGLPLEIIENPDWQAGQSSSIRAALRGLPAAAGGAIFLMADQPQVRVELLRALVERHSLDLPAVLAPYVFDQRTSPMLFDRATFSELAAITGDTGGRAIFSKFSPRYLNWYDRSLLLDVDTPEDYQKLLELEA